MLFLGQVMFLYTVLAPLLICTSVNPSKITKCCPLGRALFAGVCVNLPKNIPAPRLRVEQRLVSLDMLKTQEKLQESTKPECVESGEVFPDFTETSLLQMNAPYFSEDGVFVHEMMFYLPGDYCVEAELDTYEYDEIVKSDIEMIADVMQAIHLYLKVIICEDKALSYAGCSSKEDCYSR